MKPNKLGIGTAEKRLTISPIIYGGCCLNPYPTEKTRHTLIPSSLPHKKDCSSLGESIPLVLRCTCT